MFLVEPPYSPYDLRFQIANTPVRVHWAFWILCLIPAIGGRGIDPIDALIWTAILFISILVHEFGHALTTQGLLRIPSRVVLYSMGGMAIHDSRRATVWQEVAILLMGPGAGFLLAGLFALTVVLAGYDLTAQVDAANSMLHIWSPMISRLNDHADFAVGNIFFVNILWGLVNLLPIFPLDGGQITRALMVRYGRGDTIRNSLNISLVTAILVAVVGAVQWKSTFTAIFFAYLAFQNYQDLQGLNQRGFQRWDSGAD